MEQADALVLTALEVADPDAQIRKEVIELIRQVVAEELASYVRNNIAYIAGAVTAEARWSIKQTALSAIKEHFLAQHGINGF